MARRGCDLVEEHPGEHGGDKQPRLPSAKHQPGDCRARTEADESPASPEQNGAQDQLPIKRAVVRDEELVGEQRPIHSSAHKVGQGRRYQGGTQHEKKGWIPIAGNIEKGLDAPRIDHFRQGEPRSKNGAYE